MKHKMIYTFFVLLLCFCTIGCSDDNQITAEQIYLNTLSSEVEQTADYVEFTIVTTDCKDASQTISLFLAKKDGSGVWPITKTWRAEGNSTEPSRGTIKLYISDYLEGYGEGEFYVILSYTVTSSAGEKLFEGVVRGDTFKITANQELQPTVKTPAELGNVQGTKQETNAVATELPANVQAAISTLLSDRLYENEAKVQEAALILHAFEKSVPGFEETLRNNETGEYSKEITHTFPKAGIVITYHEGTVLSACRISDANQQGALFEATAWMPENKQVSAAISNQDVKELAHLFVVDGYSEVGIVIGVYIDEWGKRTDWEDALMTYLNHDDVTIVGNVAYFLGSMKCKRAVPSLIAVLQSDRWLIKPWLKTSGDVTMWGEYNARSRIIEALGEMGDPWAVDVLETYLLSPKQGVYPGNAAYALYKLTGKKYEFVDHDGEIKVFFPPESPER